MANVLRWTGDGLFDGDVVGESHYQKDLRRLVSGQKRKPVTARLVCETNNPYDKQAVHVEVGGKIVGYLSREDARAHRRKLEALRQAGAIVECAAVIVTGRDEVCGVYLDIVPDEEEVDDEVPITATAVLAPKIQPWRLALIMLGLFATIGVCAAAGNPIVAIVCVAIAVWLAWQWKRAGGRWVK